MSDTTTDEAGLARPLAQLRSLGEIVGRTEEQLKRVMESIP